MDIIISEQVVAYWLSNSISASYDLGIVFRKVIEGKHRFMLPEGFSQKIIQSIDTEGKKIFWMNFFRTAINKKSIYPVSGVSDPFCLEELFKRWKNVSKKDKGPTVVIVESQEELEGVRYPFTIVLNKSYECPDFEFILFEILLSRGDIYSFRNSGLSSIAKLEKLIKKLLSFENPSGVLAVGRYSNITENAVYKSIKGVPVYYYKWPHQDSLIEMRELEAIRENFRNVTIYSPSVNRHLMHERVLFIGGFVIECTDDFQNIDPDKTSWRLMFEYSQDESVERQKKFNNTNFRELT